VSGLSNSKYEGNNSIGVLLDDTWLGKRSSPDTSENFQIKIDEIKRKSKVNNFVKNAVPVHKPQKQIININNPSKFLENKKLNNNEKNEENFSEVIETAQVGTISVNPIKGGLIELNNKDNIYYNNYYTPDKEFYSKTIIKNNFRKINLEDENNIEE
jgi:hypothetical protein